MNNLTTRKIVLGMLMALVLVFSVQGIADAVSSLTRGSGDLQMYAENQPFPVSFSVGVQSPIIKAGYKLIPSTTEDDPATTSTDESGTLVTINTDAPYYNDADNNGFQGNEPPVSYADAYYYDQESIDITVSGANITQVQNVNITPATMHSMMDGGTNTTLLSTSVALTLVASGAGTVTITITDETSGGDRPSNVTPPTALVFTVYIVENAVEVNATGLDLLEAGNTTNFLRGLDDFIDPNIGASVTPAANGVTNVKIKYDVVSGSGQVYVTTADGRIGPKGTSITTSSVATVQLDMNSTTNKVTVTVLGSNTYVAPVTAFFIYGLPSLEATRGSSGQKGALNGRLENPLGIRVKDEGGRTISGLGVTFMTAVVGAEFIPLSSIPETMYTFAPATPKTITVETNSSGIAETYYQLGSSAGMEDITVEAAGVKRLDLLRATAEAATGIPAIEIVSGNNQRADSGGNVKDPLVVRVTRNNRRISDVDVTFVANRGMLTNTPLTETDAITDVQVIDKPDGSGEAQVTYFVDHSGAAEVVAYITGTSPIAYRREVTFGINGAAGTPQQQQQQQTTTGSLDISVSGTGTTRTVTVAAISAQGTPVSILVTLSGTATSTQVLASGTETTITLPTAPGSYTLTATASVAGYAQDTETITVAGPTSLGTISISQIGTPTNGVQTFSITVRRTDGTTPAPLTVTVSGSGFTTTSVPTANGSGAANITLPTAAALYTLTASATGYTSGSTTVRIAGTGQQQQQQQPAQQQPAQQQPTVSEPDSISIIGPSTRSGTVNEALDTPLLVRVLDDDGDGLEGARVFYRVTGRGRISDGSRGGRSIGVITDDDGYARANFTPTAGGSSTVRVNTDDVSRVVTFTITTGAASTTTTTTRTPGTGVTPGTSVSPVVHVGAASRPPMLWVDGGAIYALVGASPQRFASSVDNALNLTVAGGKVYWTEKTGESGGTINSANLNGSGVTELASIFATPMGIAVDVTNSKLYWTNSAGRIQSANLDGSRITNELQNLASPMDIALAGGNAYWTQGGNVRFVNLRGQKVVRNVSTGADAAGSLVIGGGKVYWTEMTGESGGTVNSANLNGTGATQLASILAAR